MFACSLQMSDCAKSAPFGCLTTWLQTAVWVADSLRLVDDFLDRQSMAGARHGRAPLGARGAFPGVRGGGFATLIGRRACADAHHCPRSTCIEGVLSGSQTGWQKRRADFSVWPGSQVPEIAQSVLALMGLCGL